MLEVLIPELAVCGLQLSSAKTKILTTSPSENCKFVDVCGEMVQLLPAETVHIRTGESETERQTMLTGGPIRILLHPIMNKTMWRALICTYCFCFYLCPSRAACGHTGFNSLFPCCRCVLVFRFFFLPFRFCKMPLPQLQVQSLKIRRPSFKSKAVIPKHLVAKRDPSENNKSIISKWVE